MFLLLRLLVTCLIVGGLIAAATVVVTGAALDGVGASLLLSSTPAALTCATGPPSDSKERVNYEPFITTSPIDAGTDHSTLIAAWSARDLDEPGKGHTVIAESRDGGQTWTLPLAAFTSCGSLGTTFQATDDPWMSIGPDGTVYLTANGEHTDNGFSATLLAETSPDGGRTWNREQAVDLPGSSVMPDKPSVTADPLKPGVAYLTWDRADTTSASPFQAPVWLATTTDGGMTWTRRELIPATKTFGAYATQLVVDPHTDALNLTFVAFRTRTSTRTQVKTVCHTVKGQRTCTTIRVKRKRTLSQQSVGFTRSVDGGATWSAPVDIATVLVNKGTGPGYPYWHLFRTGFFPAMAIDAGTGKLYVVWWVPSAKTGTILLSSSTDGGTHWSTPIRVNTPSDGPAFTPAIAVNSGGTVGVTYYTHVAAVPGQKYATKYWFQTSADGVHFTDPIALAGPFDHARALQAGGSYFFGDYMALTTSGDRFHPIFITTTDSHDMGDVLTATVSP